MTLGPWRQNSTGVPNPDDYHMGRAEVRYCELLTTGLPNEDGNGWVHMGNVINLSVGRESQVYDHFSSMVGKKQLDKRIIIQDGFTLEFECEELNENNGALWVAGTPVAYTNASIAGFTERQLITNVVKGRDYLVVDGSGQRATGFRSQDLLLEKSGAPDVALVAGTDYTVDTQTGWVHILTTGAVLANGDEVDATLTANGSAEATRLIPLLNRTAVDVAMEIVGIDAESGLRYIMRLNKVSLSPNGSMNLVTDAELARLPFAGAAERVTSLTYPVGYIIATPSTPT